MDVYRNNWPLPLLLQYVLTSCTQIPGSDQEIYSRTFEWRWPMSAIRTYNMMGVHDLQSSKFLNYTHDLHTNLKKPELFYYLDQGDIRIDDDLKTLTVSTLGTLQHLRSAFSLIYRYSSFSNLHFSAGFSGYLDLTAAKELFDKDAHLRHVTQALLKDSKTYHPLAIHASACAARNCFYEKRNVVMRPGELWSLLGNTIEPDFRNPPSDQPDFESASLIAQMGTHGLTALFAHLENKYVNQWESRYQEPAPRLNAVFDLRGNALAQNPTEYIEALAKHISEFGKKMDCAPLFENISLYVPENPTEKINQAIFSLIIQLNERKTRFSDETQTLCFFGFPFNDNLQLLGLLEEYASDGGIVLIRIPVMDEQTDPVATRYRALQNKIQDNQRARRQDLLKKNTESLDDSRRLSKANVVMSSSVAKAMQPWGDGSARYPLAPPRLALQQQVEQEQQQQQQQEQQQSQKPVPEADIEEQDITIQDYTGDEHTLLGRDNIPNEVFSILVGSTQDAPHVIQKIEQAAWDKIRRMDEETASSASVPWAMSLFFDENKANSLPFGFQLKRSKADGSLILCFDSRLEKDESREYAKRPQKWRNPFRMQLRNRFALSPLYGDANQLTLLESSWNVSADKLWGALFNNGEISQFTDKHHRVTLTKENIHAFIQLFHDYDAKDHKLRGTDRFIQMAKEVLTHFGQAHFAIWKMRVVDPSENWAELIEKEEVDALVLSIETLKSLPEEQKLWWQLVDAHGRGTDQMRYSALWYAFQTVLLYVRRNHLRISLDVLTRCTNSIAGGVQLPIRSFDAQVFLAELYFVLKQADNELHGHAMQQHILDNLDKIDWSHTGFYYASRYEGYPYWHDSLQLSGLQSSVESQKGYAVPWRADTPLADPVLHALRFACRDMHLSLEAFEQFKTMLQSPILSGASPDVIRVLTACLAVGVDTVHALVSSDQWATSVAAIRALDAEDLQWIAQQFDLTGVIKHRQIHLMWCDIAPFAKAMHQVPNIREKMKILSAEDARAFFNACGRAMQYLRGKDEGKIVALFQQTSTEKGFYLVLRYYPWINLNQYEPDSDPFINGLIRSKNDKNREEVLLFAQQLQSIDFLAGPSLLPATRELSRIFDAIAEGGREARFKEVAQLITDGCPIRMQDTRFRALTPEELTAAQHSLSRRLQPAYASQNKVLYDRFLRDHVALSTRRDALEQQEALLQYLIELDNKPHFNEVGRLLGVLMSHARQSTPAARYSAPQLTAWLKSMVNASRYAQHHYPMDILNKLLLSPLAATLVSNDLNQLQEEPQKEQQENIRKLVHSSISPDYCCAIAAYYLKGKAERADSIRVALSSDPRSVTRHYVDSFNRWLDQCIDKNYTGSEWSTLLRVLYKNQLILPKNIILEDSKNTQILSAAWERCQTKLMAMSLENKNWIRNHTTPILMIFSRAMGEQAERWDYSIYEKVETHFNKWQLTRQDDLWKLMWYFQTENPPTFDELSQMTQYAVDKKPSAEDLIKHFEIEIRGKPKRQYQPSVEDIPNLERLLGGIKIKGDRYLSHDEQSTLLNLLSYTASIAQLKQLGSIPMKDLTSLLTEFLRDQSNAYHKAAVLACLREVVLRKTGLWANHMQMLDLLFSVTHEQSTLHQIHTGQGKSVISIIRSAYLALTGHTVDLFSAKASLPERDHDEFAPVFDALGIRHHYITATSRADEYQASAKSGKGAVHFATPGHLSLFFARHVWKKTGTFSLKAPKRVAFVDEADHVFGVRVQFNLSDSEDNIGIYNFDEWVYRTAYQFYLEIRDELADDPQNGLSATEAQLKALCERLEEQSVFAPAESTFMQHFILPAASSGPYITKEIDRRNGILRQLLMASHAAQCLNGDVDYCVSFQLKTLFDSVLTCRFASVVVDNEVIENSTYSEMVHQQLHERLNHEAVLRGEAPDFLVDKLTHPALSLNTLYVLKNYYTQIEGCTRTAGNAADRARYAKELGIHQVVKLPTQQLSRSEYLPTLYCENKEAFIGAIVTKIREEYNKRPILLTFKNDKELKALHPLIVEKFSPDEKKKIRFIVDTLDTNKKEKEVVPLAGAVGAVTLSSRLGRGTHIRPETEKGLLVIRTYPAIPRTVKQETGRQGRAGAAGTSVEIINYAAVKEEYEHFSSLGSDVKERLERIREEEEAHLEEKLQKHDRASHRSPKMEALIGSEETRKKYLNSRAVEYLKDTLDQEKCQYKNRKEDLDARLSGWVMGNTQIHPDSVRSQWVEKKKAIDAYWNGRLVGRTTGDTEEIYQSFLRKVERSLDGFCELNKLKYDKEFILYNRIPGSGAKVSTGASMRGGSDSSVASRTPRTTVDASKKSIVPKQQATLHEMVAFYQVGIHNALAFHLEASSDLMGILQGYSVAVMDNLYNRMELCAKVSEDQRKLLFTALRTIMQQSFVYTIPFGELALVIWQMSNQTETPQFENYLNALCQCVSDPVIQIKSARELTRITIEKNSRLLRLIDTIIQNYCQGDDMSAEGLTRFLPCFIHALKKHYWDSFDDPITKNIQAVLSKKTVVTRLLADHFSESDVVNLIDLIKESPVGEVEARISALTNFLEKNAEFLRKHPSVIRPFIRHGLVGFSSLSSALELRELKGDLKDTDRFWSFVSQRRLINEAQTQNRITDLMTRLNAIESPRNRKKVIKALHALPLYLDLSHITPIMERYAGSHSVEECLGLLDKLKDAGQVFCRFLKKKDIISSEELLKAPDQTIKFQGMMTVFTNLNDNLKRKEFFSMAASEDFSSVPVEDVNKIGQRLIQTKEPANTATPCFEISRAIHAIPNESGLSGASRTFFLQEDFDRFLRGEERTRSSERFLSFLNVLQVKIKDGYSDVLTQGAVHLLWEKWKPQEIDNEETLERIIDVMKEVADVCGKGDDAIQHHFSNPEKRIQWMQHLEHRLLNVTESVKSKCYQIYSKQASALANAFVTTCSNRQKNAKGYQENIRNYQQMMAFVREMKTIATPPYEKVVAARGRDAVGGMRGRTLDFGEQLNLLDFSEEKNAYARFGFLTKSRTRRRQAAELFRSFYVGFRENELSFYDTWLDHIRSVQDKIFETDKKSFFRVNTKGHSRLLDISIHMMFKVIQSCLASTTFPLERKKYLLNDFIDERVKRFLQELVIRLPGNHPLRTRLSSNEVMAPRVLIPMHWSNIEKKSIPKDLHYLYDQIEMFKTYYTPDGGHVPPASAR